MIIVPDPDFEFGLRAAHLEDHLREVVRASVCASALGTLRSKRATGRQFRRGKHTNFDITRSDVRS